MTYKPKILNPLDGGTGVKNASSSTLTLGGALATSGAHATTLTMTADTNVTLPTTGTLATTAQLPSITATQYDVLVGGAANAIGSVGTGSAGQVLQSGGNAANPAYSTATYPSTAGTSGNVLTSDGTNWKSSAAPSGSPPSSLILSNVDFVDDFLYPSNSLATTSTNFGSWSTTSSGTASGVNFQANGATNVCGTVECLTGTTSTGSGAISMAKPQQMSVPIGLGIITCQWRILIPVLSNGTDRFSIIVGLGDSATGAPGSNGIWFSYADNVNSGAWVVNTKASGTATTGNTSTTPSGGTWYTLKMVVNAGGTSVGFFVDGTQVANSPITTHIPTSGIAPVLAVIKSLGTSGRFVDADFCTLNLVWTTPRSG